MIINTVEEMIQDIKQNIERLSNEKKFQDNQYGKGQLKHSHWQMKTTQINSSIDAYRHCLEMAEALQHSLECKTLIEEDILSDKDKAQQFFNSMSQGSIPQK